MQHTYSAVAAIAIAIRASVTVSIALEMSRTANVMLRVKPGGGRTALGIRFDSLGKSNASS